MKILLSNLYLFVTYFTPLVIDRYIFWEKSDEIISFFCLDIQKSVTFALHNFLLTV